MSPFVGSEEHRKLICRFFLETHQPYDPATIEWPELDEPARLRLVELPIWEEAIRIEAAELFESIHAVSAKSHIRKAHDGE